MTPRTRDRSLGDGVYFNPHDYVGFGRRLLIFIIDVPLLVMIQAVMAMVWAVAIGEFTPTFSLLALLTTWLYVVPLKRSRFRTLGYRLLGCKLVTFQGTRPSLIALTFRSLLWIVGPLNFLLDIIWCSLDDDRQTMRDRFSGMCLVRNNAEPIGTGEVHLAYLNTLGYNFAYPRVVHPKPLAAS